ncbi:O-glucosyltransferase rumi homolog isoform X2 [Lasioglossum baleicum]|uniref:O-glucosyltransferase rumi homolog isoform X2 n=1 Tax=Lasioglossum baleicum TaxID=434251 RepID=UPI003FCDF346
MLILNYIFFIAIFWTGHCEEQYCSIDSAEHCDSERETNVYDKGSKEEYKKYYHAIEEAKKNYQFCNNTNNGCYKNVITQDLKPFKHQGISKDLINAAKNRGTFYQIIQGNIYRQKDCMFPSRCAGIEHFLLKLAPNLPDIDLMVNTRDYPQASKHFDSPLPIFSFSKTAHYYDITYPAWSFWEGGPAISLYPRGLGRWDEHRISLDKASEDTPWSKKESKGFFRGSRTSSERDNLVLLSREKPELVDAQYTKNQAWKSDEDTLHAPPAAEASLESHLFHVGDEWTEFYYDAMVPWIHYIPVSKNANQSVLEEIIQFAKDNDELSREIANRGRDFVWNNLKMSDVLQYWKKLLQRYSKLLTYKPSLDKTLTRIKKRES